MEPIEILCPKCQESIRMTVNNYKIKLYECKNGHSINNILLDEFEKKQNNILRLKCGNVECIENNENHKKYYECLTCGIIFCQSCKSIHDDKHKIIDYNKKNCICKSHYINYNYYCEKCHINFCRECEHKCKYIEYKSKESKSNEINEINNKIKNLREKIDKFKEIKNNYINILNNVYNNFENYFKLINNMIDKYNKYKEVRNYQINQNIVDINNYNEIIMQDLDKIIK